MAAALSLLVLLTPANGAQTVSRHGITWNWTEDRQTGQFANGDHWVIGPITLTSISPAATTSGRAMNGTMLNPVAGPGIQQGFDSTMTANSYSEGKNVGNDLPLSIPAGTSIVSSRSNGGAGSRPQLADAAVLTVLAAAPPANAFRPPYCGTDKTIPGTVADLNFSILANYPLPASAPALAGVESNFERTWIEIQTEFGGREMHPSNNQPDYGRDMGMQLSQGLLLLQTNLTNAQKQTLYMRLVQYGIDVYGAAKAGGNWRNNGGHNQGRKMPMILAGLALGKEEILQYANAKEHFIFGEDQQTFYVTQADVDLARHSADGRTRNEYTNAMIGMPEWGEKHSTSPSRDGSNWGVSYREIVIQGCVGHIITAHILGVEDLWNHPVIFDYFDNRVRTIGAATPTKFETDMWDIFDQLGAGAGVATPKFTPPGGTFNQPQSVVITSTTPNATIRYTTDGSTPSADDPLYSGPISIGLGTTTLRAIAYDPGMEESRIEQGTYKIGSYVAEPVVSPKGGRYLSGQDVWISTVTPLAKIYYTKDGTTPTSSSIEYSGPIRLESNTVLRAVGILAGSVSSDVVIESYEIGEIVSSGARWENAGIPKQMGEFTVSLNVTPGAALADSLVGLSEAKAETWTDLAAIVRFSPTGIVDARNGGKYEAVNPLNYQPGVKYLITMTVNIPSKTYSVTVGALGMPSVVIASDFGFRTEQADVSQLNWLAGWTVLGETKIGGLTFGEGSPLPPVGLRVVE